MPFKKFLLLPLLLLLNFYTDAQTKSSLKDVDFDIRVVASKLSDPWEVTYGPDGFLWVTESKGYRVLRIDPVDGSKQILADLNSERKFGAKPWPQGGLMGLALHPLMLQEKGKPFVYLAYVHQYKGDNRFSLRIVRYTYDRDVVKLINPTIICDTIPASNDHNGGRLLIAPVNGKPYLFYSIGDMGSGQFSNGGRINNAQNKQSYEGKILRFNLEPDKDANEGDQWIPDDNPFNTAKQSAVWTVGHRNPQGLAYAPINGKDIIYSTEHGPYSDDEINIIERGSNYGHPLIIGYDDGNYNGLAASVSDNSDYPGVWHTTYPFIQNEKQNARSIGSSYRNPIKSFFPTPNKVLTALFEKTKKGEEQDWVSFAPSSVEVYQSDAIPEWKNSLLIPTLKGSRLLRLKLDDRGKIADSTIYEYVKGNVRYRDIAVSSDGLKLYLAVDSSSVTSGPSKENPKEISYRGSILELKYKAAPKQPAKSQDF